MLNVSLSNALSFIVLSYKNYISARYDKNQLNIYRVKSIVIWIKNKLS